MSDSLIPPRVIGTPDPNADFDNDPELAGLLDFEPAPRKVNRPDGWSPERQRRFIQLIVETGSPQRAAVAMGKVLSGVEYVYRSEGAEGFRAAWDRAVEIVRTREERRLAGLTADKVKEPPHRREAARAMHNPHPDPPPRGKGDNAQRDVIEALFRKFVIKVRAERKARLAGRIAEADFYLRQISFFEVALELSSDVALDAFAELRRNGVHLVDIAQTDGTQILDRIRRKAWIELELERVRNNPSPFKGEGDSANADRGEGDGADEDEDDLFDLDLFPRHLLADHPSTSSGQGFRTEPLPCEGPYRHPAERHGAEEWARLDEHARAQAYDEQFGRAAAEEQVKWEQEMLTIVTEEAKRQEGRERPPTDWESWA